MAWEHDRSFGAPAAWRSRSGPAWRTYDRAYGIYRLFGFFGHAMNDQLGTSRCCRAANGSASSCALQESRPARGRLVLITPPDRTAGLAAIRRAATAR